MSVTFADVGFLPIIVAWAALMIFSRAQSARKRRDQEQVGPPRPPSPAPKSTPPRASPAAPAAQGGLMAELRRAMDELKRAEMQQMSRERPSAEEHRAVSTTPPSRAGSVDARAQEYLASRRRVAAPAPRTPHLEHHSLIEHVLAKPDDAGALETAARTPSRRAPDVPPAPPASESAPQPHGPLAKYGDGTARGAFTLSAILGRPRSEQPHDA